MIDLQVRDFIKTIKLFHDNDCISHIVIVGSWAEHLYVETGILPSYSANIKTLDLDLLVKNMRYPRQGINLIELAKEAGYHIESERLSGITKFLLPGSLEVEFLLSKRGAGRETALKTNLGVTAQTLRDMEILIENTIKVDYFGMTLELPSPEAFVLHKMTINKERKEKSEKDRMSINEMYRHLDSNRFESLLLTQTKKNQKIIRSYIDHFIIPAIEETRRIEEARGKIFQKN